MHWTCSISPVKDPGKQQEIFMFCGK